MKKCLTVFSFLCLSIGTMAQSKSFDEKAKLYIKKYGAWAIEEQQRSGIPASITLAQGIYETGAGESELATQANNHFGIKCKKEWRGATFAHTDDAPNECFRKYTTAKESYIDHSDYLKNSVRYAELFTFDKSDYKSWAKGLKRCGYATNPIYAQKLIKMIEDYDLQTYTFAAVTATTDEGILLADATPAKTTPVNRNFITDAADQAQEMIMGSREDGTVRVNDLRAVYCTKGETLLDKAMKYNIRYARLLEINELTDEPLKREMYIYLEPKKNKGTRAVYIVKEGETIELIAHNEGMNSRQLRIYNLLAQNEQAVPGSVLKLQEQSDERPATYTQVKNTVVTAPVQNVRLVNPNQPVQDEYLPTKRSKQKVEEEVTMGYGAEPPVISGVAEPTPQPKVLKPAVSKVQPVQTVSQQKPLLSEKSTPVLAPVTKEVVPATSNKLESELAAQNDAGDLPQSLEPEVESKEEEPKDELAILKAKLDKAVYARSSKSNMKVSSDDSAAVFAPKNITTASAAKQTAMKEEAVAGAVFHTVQKGDTGYSIAQKYGIKVKDLNEMNNLNFEGIKIGQKLRVK